MLIVLTSMDYGRLTRSSYHKDTTILSAFYFEGIRSLMKTAFSASLDVYRSSARYHGKIVLYLLVWTALTSNYIHYATDISLTSLITSL